LLRPHTVGLRWKFGWSFKEHPHRNPTLRAFKGDFIAAERKKDYETIASYGRLLQQFLCLKKSKVNRKEL